MVKCDKNQGEIKLSRNVRICAFRNDICVHSWSCVRNYVCGLMRLLFLDTPVQYTGIVQIVEKYFCNIMGVLINTSHQSYVHL